MKALKITMLFIFSLNSLFAIEPIFVKKLSDSGITKCRFSPDRKTFQTTYGRTVQFFDTKTWELKNTIIVPDSIKEYFEITTDGKYLVNLFDKSQISNLPAYSFKSYELPDYKLMREDQYNGEGYPYYFNGFESVSTDSFFLFCYSIQRMIPLGKETEYSGIAYYPYSDSFSGFPVGEVLSVANHQNKFIGIRTVIQEQQPSGHPPTHKETIQTYLCDNAGKVINEIESVKLNNSEVISNNDVFCLWDSASVIYSNYVKEESRFEVKNQESNYFFTDNLFSYHFFDSKNLVFSLINSEDSDSLLILHHPTRMILDKYIFKSNIVDMFLSSGTDSIFVLDESGNIFIFSLYDYLSKNSLNIASDRNLCIISQKIQFYTINYDSCKSYLWEFGDGSTSNERNPIHSYSFPGTYTIKLQIELIDNTKKSITKSDYVKIDGIFNDSLSGIKLLWSNEFPSKQGEIFQYSTDGKTLGINSLDNKIFLLNYKNGIDEISKDYPESIAVGLSSDNGNLFFIPKLYHDNENIYDTINCMNLFDNSKDYYSFKRTSCNNDFSNEDYSYYGYEFFPDKNPNSMNLLYSMSCSNMYFSMNLSKFYKTNIDSSNKTTISMDIGAHYRNKTYPINWKYCYSLFTGKKFGEYHVFDFEKMADTKLIDGVKPCGNNVWLSTKYHNNDILVYNAWYEKFLLYYREQDSSWTELKSISDDIKKFQNIKGTDYFLMIGSDGSILIFDPERDSVLSRIQVSGNLVNMAISPVDSQFSVINDQGMIYTFTSSFLSSNKEPEPENQILIFPNPASDKIRIDLKEEQKNNQMQIYSPLGVLLFEIKATDEIDVSSFPIGIYFIRIGNSVNKFVKL